MSVEFSNTYQEVLLDNLMVIIKQNFMFQTQLKMAENVGNKNAELQNQTNQLVEENNHLRVKLSEIEAYKSKIDTNNSAHEEKTRIQMALNDEMKKTKALEKNLIESDTEIKELKDYITKLEEIAPITKLKKINPNFKDDRKTEIVETAIEPTPINPLPIKVNDGSSF